MSAVSQAPEKVYLPALEELKRLGDSLPNTRMHVVGKVTSLVLLNMRWEQIMVDREYPVHPWPRVQELIQDAHRQLQSWSEASFIEGPSTPLGSVSDAMEDRHHDLFQDLWVNFSEADYRERIARYTRRLEINGLG